MKNVCILAHLNTCQHVSKGTAPDFFSPVKSLHATGPFLSPVFTVTTKTIRCVFCSSRQIEAGLLRILQVGC